MGMRLVQVLPVYMQKVHRGPSRSSTIVVVPAAAVGERGRERLKHLYGLV
jgi:hypothetical protein